MSEKNYGIKKSDLNQLLDEYVLRSGGMIAYI